MAHYGLLRGYRFDRLDTGADIRGCNVYGRADERLGKIDDVIFDHSTGVIRYVVVDSGGWFSHKKFLVPPHRLHSAANHEVAFAVNLDKSQIENLPRDTESDLESRDKWGDYAKRFDAAWHAGPVIHRTGSDRDVTPTSEEMRVEADSTGSELSPSQRGEVNSSITPGPSNEVSAVNGAMGLGSRWLNFEEHLRQRRRDITRTCTVCAVSPASDRSSDSAIQERKAI